ncbi:MAG: hypothetical protein ACREI2_12480 [Nitrospiraceae bacterium]
MGRPTNRWLLIALLILFGPQLIDPGWAERFGIGSTLGPLHAQDQLPIETDGLAEVGDGEGEYEEEFLSTGMAHFHFRFPMTVLSTDVSATRVPALTSSVFHPPTNV